MEQRSKVWEDEASFDKSPRNSFFFILFNKYFKGLEQSSTNLLRTPCCKFFWWSPFYSYLTKYYQFHKYRMITNAQEESLVNGKQIMLCAMNFSQARSRNFGKNIDSMNVFVWGLAYHDVYMCRQRLTPFQCSAKFQSTMSSSHYWQIMSCFLITWKVWVANYYVLFLDDIILWAHCYEHKIWVTNYLFVLMIWHICVANYVLFLEDIKVREVN